MAKKNMNIVVFDGNIGKCKEMRLTSTGGKAVMSFSLAVNDTYQSNGQQVATTVWVECTTFGRLAEVCNQYLLKGKHVLVNGRLTPQRSYDKADGTKGYSGYEMVCNEVFFIDGPAAGTRETGDAADEEVAPAAAGGIAWEGSAN